jgi:4-amino-4-deoxychorismate lyase
MSTWFHDGRPVESVALDERGFQYGDGLFETIAIRDGAPRLWNLHLERLTDGCKRLAIAPPDAGMLSRWLDSALAHADVGAAHCLAKMVVTSGTSHRGYGRTNIATPSVFIGVFASAPLDAAAYRDGIDTIRCKTPLAVGSVTAGLKTLNRIEQVLARSECLAAGVFEGLVFDADTRLICGTMSNVFLVSNNTIITADLARCGVAGVMRRHLMTTLRNDGHDVQALDLGEGDLRRADEVFLTNSQFGVLPVTRCDSNSWSIGPVTRGVMDLLADNGIEECTA